MYDYISYFFIYAIIGWILEVAFHVITQAKFINRGFLSGPYCPIYGFGALAVIGFLNLIGDENKLFLFLSAMVISTLLELITGFLLEKIFHKRWWDYSSKKFNVGGYICIEFSLLWGAICFILYEAIHPLIRKAIMFIPDKLLLAINIIMVLTLIIDLVATINTITGLNKKFKAIENQSKDIRKVSDNIGKKVADKTFVVLDKKRDIENSRLFKEFDERSKEFRQNFQKQGEKRLLKAFPHLIHDLEDRKYDLSIKDKINKK